MRISHNRRSCRHVATSIPSTYAQQDGPVGGRVGSDLSTSGTQPGSAPSARPYAGPLATGHLAGWQL